MEEKQKKEIVPNSRYRIKKIKQKLKAMCHNNSIGCFCPENNYSFEYQYFSVIHKRTGVLRASKTNLISCKYNSKPNKSYMGDKLLSTIQDSDT